MNRTIRLALLVVLSLSFQAAAETAVDEYQLKAEFIERFTRFIDWPPHNGATFVIAVIGDTPLLPHLRLMASSRQIRGRRVEVRTIAHLEDLDDPDVLFIGADEKKSLSHILRQTTGRPILTISDSPGFGEEGVLINFYRASDTIRFEINGDSVDRSGLRFSSKLLKLARIVDAGGPR